MILRIFGHDFHYECENLCRVYFPNEKINIVYGDEGDDLKEVATRCIPVDGAEKSLEAQVLAPENELRDKSELKTAQLIFAALSELTGYTPPWGVLTGVRPSKLMLRLIADMGEEAAMNYFLGSLLVSPEKASLAKTVADAEEKIVALSQKDSFSLYVSIPFCPTRCSYCSFVSHSIANSNAKKLLPEYLDKLAEEIELTGAVASELGLKLESVYFGGGTPGVLEAPQMDRLLSGIEKSFDLSTVREYTVEVGRPDTVTPEKLRVLKLHDVGRISINPQTFNDGVLNEIGRRHTSGQTEDAMLLAREEGFLNINMDLILGLPGETTEDVARTLEGIGKMGPESMTVHSLAVKRASRLNQNLELYPPAPQEEVNQMIHMAWQQAESMGMEPYYLYRQKNMAGNLENVGYAKPGKECLYNILIMEEKQSIIALGAGGSTKIVFPEENRIERVENVKSVKDYIERIDEMIGRKEKNLKKA